jgi:hypothetical protein
MRARFAAALLSGSKIRFTVEDVSAVGGHVGRNDDTSDLTGAVVMGLSENDGYAS